MRRIVGSLMLSVAAFVTASAQDAPTVVEQRAEALRAQLREVTEKQTQLQAREQQLDEELKPENIERSLAGVGTTDATALRDRRRQQLEREKATVEEQLQSLATSRSQLEDSIASAEAEAVRLRAAALNTNSAPRQTTAGAPAPSAAPKTPSARRVSRRRHRKARRRPR
jgi:chaperonin cofactor prefoldin